MHPYCGPNGERTIPVNNQPDPHTDGPVRPVCRRCKRPLHDPASIAAGIGARCAQIEALEAAQHAPMAPSGPSVPEAVIALITARLACLPDAVAAGILRDTPNGDLAVQLADVAAWMVQNTGGGEAWLRRLGLRWAREVHA